MKLSTLIIAVMFSFGAKAQKVDSIFFNLYTDSLKKGVHNYINVVAKLSDGSYYPLTADEVTFTSCAGKWEGNSLIIDSAYQRDSVVVHAALKKDTSKKKSITIYMKKMLVEPELKTQQELLDEWNRKSKKGKGSK